MTRASSPERCGSAEAKTATLAPAERHAAVRDTMPYFPREIKLREVSQFGVGLGTLTKAYKA